MKRKILEVSKTWPNRKCIRFNMKVCFYFIFLFLFLTLNLAIYLKESFNLKKKSLKAFKFKERKKEIIHNNGFAFNTDIVLSWIWRDGKTPSLLKFCIALGC